MSNRRNYFEFSKLFQRGLRGDYLWGILRNTLRTDLTLEALSNELEQLLEENFYHDPNLWIETDPDVKQYALPLGNRRYFLRQLLGAHRNKPKGWIHRNWQNMDYWEEAIISLNDIEDKEYLDLIEQAGYGQTPLTSKEAQYEADLAVVELYFETYYLPAEIS